MGKKKNPKVYNYSDIIDCDLIEDEDSITKGGLGRAVAGGLLFGGVGAVVGGITGGKKTKSIVNSMKIKITVNDMTDPVAYVTLISAPTKTSSFIYKTAEKTAHEILSAIAVILNENAASNPAAEVSMSETDEIRRYKQLLDDGIISQEEFETKKKQLLGI